MKVGVVGKAKVLKFGDSHIVGVYLPTWVNESVGIVDFLYYLCKNPSTGAYYVDRFHINAIKYQEKHLAETIASEYNTSPEYLS